MMAGRRKERLSEPMREHVVVDEAPYPTDRTLVKGDRTWAHQQLPIDELVAVPVVGECEDFVAGPAAREVDLLGRHAHWVRSAEGRRQDGIESDRSTRCRPPSYRYAASWIGVCTG